MTTFHSSVMANPKQYSINKLSSVCISIVQSIKLFSSVIMDMTILRSRPLAGSFEG
jgi:hypothetical protein